MSKEEYRRKKEAAREEAIEWMRESSFYSLTWGELAEAGAHFEKLGKRYGLTTEFRENGLI